MNRRSAIAGVGLPKGLPPRRLVFSRSMPMLFSKRPSRIRSALPRAHARPTPGQGWRKTTNYRQWRMEVLARDGQRCQFCGSTKNLTAHHVVPASVDPALRYEVRNGITLCRGCHRALDRAHGDLLLPRCCATCPFVQIMRMTEDMRQTGDRRRLKQFYAEEE